MTFGVGEYDALHVACAIKGDADIFVTTFRILRSTNPQGVKRDARGLSCVAQGLQNFTKASVNFTDVPCPTKFHLDPVFNQKGLINRYSS
jgi:hypothetical protein